MDCDPGLCASRNVHGRIEKDIQSIHRGWEPTPSHFNKVDFSSFLQDKEIDHVEMADAEDDEDNPIKADDKPSEAEKEKTDDLSLTDLKSLGSPTNKTKNEVRREVKDSTFSLRIINIL